MNEATFERLSFRERGHFSNHFTLNPVLSLTFGPAALSIVRRSGRTSHPYNTLNVEIIKTFVAKGYGKAAHAYIPQTLVKLSGPAVTCAFDLSQQFPDFRNPEAVMFMSRRTLAWSVSVRRLLLR